MLGHELGPWFARLARMMIGSTEEAGGAATRMDDPRRYGELVLMVAVVRVGKMLSDGWLNGAQLSLSSLIRYTPLSMPRATSGEGCIFPVTRVHAIGTFCTQELLRDILCQQQGLWLCIVKRLGAIFFPG